MSTKTPTGKPKAEDPKQPGMRTRSRSKQTPPQPQKRPLQAHNDLEHPYTAKVDHKISQLRVIMNKIFALADNDLLIVDRDTGLNDYKMNEKFADKLEDVGKYLIGLQKECDAKATEIRDHVQKFKDKKLDQQDLCMITDTLKKGSHRDPAVSEEYSIVKCSQYAAWVSSGSENDEPEAGDMDTKFKYRKVNANDSIYGCTGCEQTFRNKVELRNHYSTHHKELYRCMKCSVICRSQRSFYNHKQTHTGVIYTCKVCGMNFILKTSYNNHQQKHNKEKLVCDKCGKKFQYRQSYLEHITYRHRSSKSIPCPV